MAEPIEISGVYDVTSQPDGTEEARIKPQIKEKLDRLVEKFPTLAGDAAFLTGSTMLASVPLVDTTVGGAALAACAAILTDLHTTGGKTIAKAAGKIFGSVDNALGTCALASCVALGVGGLREVFEDGHPAGLIKALANVGPYAVGSTVDFGDQVKKRIEKELGKEVEVPFTNPNTGETIVKRVSSVRLVQQMSFLIGALGIAGYGFIEQHSALQIGGLFAGANTLAIIEMVRPYKIGQALKEVWKDDTTKAEVPGFVKGLAGAWRKRRSGQKSELQ